MSEPLESLRWKEHTLASELNAVRAEILTRICFKCGKELLTVGLGPMQLCSKCKTETEAEIKDTEDGNTD